MSEAKAYVEVAERAISAANGAMTNQIHEKAAFMGYHAFESIGGAFCAKNNVPYSMKHPAKINTFVHVTKRERFSPQVAHLAILYRSMRNLLLYPVVARDGTVQHPKNVISDAEASRLIGRTNSLVQKIKPLI